MDEIIRGRQLAAEIMQKAASIRRDMIDVNKGLERMSLVEEQQRAKSARASRPSGDCAAPAAAGLADLPGDVLIIIVGCLTECRDVMSLNRTCRRLQAAVGADAFGWAARCRKDWGICNASPDTVPRLVPPIAASRPTSAASRPTSARPSSSPSGDSLRSQSSFKDADANTEVQQGTEEVAAADRHRDGSGLPSPREAVRNPWFDIYCERSQGMRHGLQLLQWLKQHGCPETVSGFTHRKQLNAALRCMALCTAAQEADKRRRQQVFHHGAVASLLSLCRNEASAVQEGALQVLANLAAGEEDEQEPRDQLMAASGLGKSLSDMLNRGRESGVVLQAARALLNMWHTVDCPTVAPVTAEGRVAGPRLEGGEWVLLEFSMRGDVMSRMSLELSFDSGTISGSCAEPVACVLSGNVDALSSAWLFRRTQKTDQRTVLYQGQSDLHGAFGTYQAPSAQGAAAVFFGIRAMGPRVFRLLRLDAAVAIDQPAPIIMVA